MLIKNLELLVLDVDIGFNPITIVSNKAKNNEKWKNSKRYYETKIGKKIFFKIIKYSIFLFLFLI